MPAVRGCISSKQDIVFYRVIAFATVTAAASHDRSRSPQAQPSPAWTLQRRRQPASGRYCLSFGASSSPPPSAASAPSACTCTALRRHPSGGTTAWCCSPEARPRTPMQREPEPAMADRVDAAPPRPSARGRRKMEREFNLYVCRATPIPQAVRKRCSTRRAGTTHTAPSRTRP